MKERYDNLDGLRTISCLCLIAMHIQANANYTIHPILQFIMVSWTHFVLLFLMISGFGMFCGYYERCKNGEYSINDFYLKRYKEISPFFIPLIVIDVLMNRSLSHVIEGITEATLVFGLLPNNQPDVIGVSWTLGVIFLFYMLFPFFVFLFWTKKRACFSFVISVLISIFCAIYYFRDSFVVDGFTARHSFIYCAPFFAGGAVVYLYRAPIKQVVNRYRWICLVVLIILSGLCFSLPNEGEMIDLFILLRYLCLFILWLMYSISVDSWILNNKITKFFSGISLEMYLAHMIIFRVLEKVNVLYIFGSGTISLFITYILTIIGLLVFIRVWEWIWTIFIQRIILQKQT